MAVTHGRGLWTVDTFDDCNGNLIPDEDDIGSGFSPDANMNDIPDECETGIPPGRMDPNQILLGKDSSDVFIRCPESCSLGAVGYGLYQGALGSWYSHRAVAGKCQEVCPTDIVVTAPAGSAYYLLVPHNGFAEGSYGTDRDSAKVRHERPRATLVQDRCYEFQNVAACP